MDISCVENIEPIAKSVFSTMLSLELERIDDLPADFETRLIASIQITGKWLGSVSILFSKDAILNASAAMLMSKPSDVTEADQRDVGAELVNMIGGNFKSLLPTPVQLSLPSTSSGEHLESAVHGATLIDTQSFAFNGGYLQVRLHESLQA